MTAYFLSDLHLGAPYFPDSKEAEKRVVDFLDSIKEDADSIFLLGDILDYWYEYKYVVPRGFVRFFGKLAELSDRGIRIVWFIGNHDIWIYDYLPSELGIEVIDGSAVEDLDGVKFFMTHGDGIGKLKPAFRCLRSLFRNRFCQFLFAGIHPRWTVPFAYNWSRSSRMKSCDVASVAEFMRDNILTFTREYHQQHPDVRYFVFGHLHLFEKIDLDADTQIILLGEWISKFSFAKWNGHELTLHQWTGARKNADENGNNDKKSNRM